MIALFDHYNQAGDLDKCQALLDRLAGRPKLPQSMGLSKLSNCHKKPTQRKIKAKRHGLKGISAKAKRIIRSDAAVIEQKAPGRGDCSFLTLTIPPLPDDLLLIISENSGQIMRQFCQWLSRKLQACGLSGWVVWVAEIQEKRYKAWGQVVVHWHLLFQGRDRSRDIDWVITPDMVREYWQKLLESQIGRPVDCKAATRIERPRKSLQREMGKYVSKGGAMTGQIVEDGKADYLPRQWWGHSRELGREVKSQIFHAKGIEATLIINHLDLLQQLGILKFRPIEIEIKGQGLSVTESYQTGSLVYKPETYKVTVGYCGFFLTDDWKRLFTTDEAKFGRVLERLQICQAQMAA